MRGHPNLLGYAPPSAAPSPFRRWVWAHVVASYLAVACMVATGLANSDRPGGEDGPEPRFAMCATVAPLWVPPFMIGVAAQALAGRQESPPASYFATVGTYVMALLLVARALRPRPWLGHGPAGLCPGCGYDLRATPDRCPECGAVPAQGTA